MFEPDEVREILVGAARAGNALTYSQMLGLLGHRFTRPLMRQLCTVLDAIDEDGRVAGEPGLAVLVVRQSDGLPGQGWFASRSATHPDLPLEWEGAEARRYIEAKQREAFEYWSGRQARQG
ncbi:ribose-phosphate pyrophosphokinase [Erythrobacter sp. GH1-10]|uniref:ribose-phosphate pyrophosphokinase n=1 Tax=Erythrobacter sp. GH1-10 TaxID=3349334 RepID=UPI003877A437